MTPVAIGGRGLAALALLLLAGCARPARDDLYVLLPAPDGTTGAISVESDGKTAVLDQPYAAARVKEPGRVEAGTVTEREARRAFGAQETPGPMLRSENLTEPPRGEAHARGSAPTAGLRPERPPTSH